MRRQARQERSRPLLTALERFFCDKLALLSQKSTLAVAIRYATSRWDGLTLYADDGRVEIPKIESHVTRVSLHGGTCPCCAGRFKAEAPAGLERGSPFGPNIRAFVIYLRAVQGIPLARLRDALLDLFGVTISEGTLVNVLSAAAALFKAAMLLIKARLLGGTALASDETGVRVGRANWWLWAEPA